MDKLEIINGLRAGRTLMMDGAATEDERNLLSELEQEGLVDITLVTGDQYSAYRITYKTQPTEVNNKYGKRS